MRTVETRLEGARIRVYLDEDGSVFIDREDYEKWLEFSLEDPRLNSYTVNGRTVVPERDFLKLEIEDGINDFIWDYLLNVGPMLRLIATTSTKTKD